MATIYKIKELGLQTIETATGKARDLLDAAKRQFGFVPNMYGAMANEPALLEAYSSTYAAFRRDAGFTPVEQEVIFLVISRANGCHYCVAAHSFVADKMSKVPTEVTDAIRDVRAIVDPKLQALATFTRLMVDTRGRPSEGAVHEFFAAGYSEKSILGIILAIGVKTYSNYTNHLFHTPVDEVFASRMWKEAA
jgi:uncharacterized peroxidase-related enzyme